MPGADKTGIPPEPYLTSGDCDRESGVDGEDCDRINQARAGLGDLGLGGVVNENASAELGVQTAAEE